MKFCLGTRQRPHCSGFSAASGAASGFAGAGLDDWPRATSVTIFAVRGPLIGQL
jgi:hypothetical protein